MGNFFQRDAMDFPIPLAMTLVFAALLEPITHRRRAIGGSIYLVSDDFTAAIETRPASSQGLKDRSKTEQTAAAYTVKKSPRTPAASKTLPAP